MSQSHPKKLKCLDSFKLDCNHWFHCSHQWSLWGQIEGILLIRLLIYLAHQGLTGDNQRDCVVAVSRHNVTQDT
jgi:hypothetical protein